MNKGDWEGKTGGGHFGQNVLFSVLRTINVRFIYPVLYIVIPFYMLFCHKEYKASYSFYRNRLGNKPLKSFFLSYRNFMTFGKVVLDKFASFAGNTKQFKLTVKDRDIFTQMLQEKSGFIAVSAHVGNFEMAGSSLQQDIKKFNYIFWGGESENINKRRLEIFKRVNPDAQLITIGNDISYLFDIKAALDNGEVLITSCDRLCGSPQKYDTEFIGAQASFPLGIFTIAAKLNIPMLAIYIFKGKGLKYDGFVKKISCDDSIKSSKERATYLAKQYVEILEETIKEHPLQWFNFYNFWETTETKKE